MQIKLTLTTVLLALTSSTLAILPPPIVNPLTHTRPFWARPGGIIRPAVCSSNPNSALYCKGHTGSGYDKRSPEPVWSGLKGDGIIRPAVCSSNPNSPLYCPGTKTSYYGKRDAQFRAQVCSSNPNSPFYCKGNSYSDVIANRYQSQRRGLGPAPVQWRKGKDGRWHRMPSLMWAGAKRGLGPAPVHWRQGNDGRWHRLPPVTWAGAPRLGGIHIGAGKRSYGSGRTGGRRGAAKKPRMMVCSFDKKSPNYCPGLEKDAEKIDDRKGRGRGFFA